MKPERFAIHSPCRSGRQATFAFLALLVSACGGGGGAHTSIALPGQELTKPGGGLFLVDENHSGGASRLHLVEMFWGRLVDVHDIDETGAPSSAPLYRDLPINENVQTDSDKYLLTTNAITQRTQLVIRRTHGAPDTGTGTFHTLLAAAQSGMAPVLPKNDDGSAPLPISFVARNAAIVLRIDDLLDDGAVAVEELQETVRVLTGYPPVTPFQARLYFDPNHGGIGGGEFHSTRVIVDLSVSATEASASPVPLQLNSDGLPASRATLPDPNASIRIPTRRSEGTGQFALLHGLSGAPLTDQDDGPVDPSSPSHELVRALRAGNPSDANNGFLLDLNAPTIVGSWPLAVEDARIDPDGLAGLDWRIDLRFTTACRAAPGIGDICSVNDAFFEVRAQGSAPNSNGRVPDLRVRALLDRSITDPSFLLGQGSLLSRFDADKPVNTGCWVSFTPPPNELPQDRVVPEAHVVVRFSEPMDPSSVDALENLQIVRGDAAVTPRAETIVVCRVAPSADLREFTLLPDLPFAHAGGGEKYHMLFGHLTDLAGNGLEDAPKEITFSIDPAAPVHANAGLVLRFGDVEEMPPDDGADLRGQLFYDFTDGRIRPRPVTFQASSADRTNPVPSIMIPFPPGVQTPLSPLGSKLQAVYRYCDLGWNVRDETKYNVDVIGLAWSPIGGQVISDFYEGFEVRLAHSRFLPDECIDANLLPDHPTSGLLGDPRFFTENILVDPLSPQKIVHPRPLGYAVNQASLFLGPTGTKFEPYPLNRGGGPLVSYTWRDTAVLARAGPNGDGIPLCVEARRPLFLETQAGSVAGPSNVPSFGLPLLMEFRCYPSNTGVGLNSLDISLAINSSAIPAFRAYSTGGINKNGIAISVDPDLELVPRGGFNPNSTPPGKKTALSAENAFYIGHVDYVARVSRVHSAWYDTGNDSPDYLPPVVQPPASLQPIGTEAVLEYRGATGFNSTPAKPFDASTLDPYGEPKDIQNAVRFYQNRKTWTNDINLLDGARYLQLRISFLSNIDTGLTPDLAALGFAFSFD